MTSQCGDLRGTGLAQKVATSGEEAPVPYPITQPRRDTTYPARRWRGWTISGGAAVFVAGSAVSAWAQAPDVLTGATEAANTAVLGLQDELSAALVRLPLAALLGAALALRPKRKGTPERSMPVIETQIILAVVGALIMLIVGASLARAFGIVGAANLIRYRAKIDDPKDAVVMLSALAVGLASGVGLYGLAVFGTVFTAAILWAIEGFEPAERKVFDLTLKREEGVVDLKPQVEQVLRRFRTDFEIRASAEDLLSYVVTARRDFQVDRVSEALTALAPERELAVEWTEAKPKKKAA
jgi:hypothetical protein